MNEWDERYRRTVSLYGDEPSAFLVDVEATLPRRLRILSIGEGEGRNAMLLARRGHQVTAVDASAVAVDRTRARAARCGAPVEVVHADLLDYDLGEARWDAVVSIWVHLAAAARERLHAAIVRALRPGGRVILQAYRPEQLRFGTGGPRDAALLYTLALLEHDFRQLITERAVELVREIREGAAHNGTSAVVELVARKPEP